MRAVVERDQNTTGGQIHLKTHNMHEKATHHRTCVSDNL